MVVVCMPGAAGVGTLPWTPFCALQPMKVMFAPRDPVRDIGPCIRTYLDSLTYRETIYAVEPQRITEMSFFGLDTQPNQIGRKTLPQTIAHLLMRLVNVQWKASLGHA